MAKGVDVIVQGVLADGHWLGRPDVMCRVPTKSVLGDWSYEISDTKLAKETKAGTIFSSASTRICSVFSRRRGRSSSTSSRRTRSIEETYRVDDYAAYFRLVKAKMLAAVDEGDVALAAANYPEPVAHCEICQWFKPCATRRRDDDHLSLVAGISRVQRQELVLAR
jgi:uncharacterized protein